MSKKNDSMEKELFEFLKAVNVMCRSNALRFSDKPEDRKRIDVIKETLHGTSYEVEELSCNLFCHKKPYEEYKSPVVLVSHIDVVDTITECYTKEKKNTVRGTLDNAATNASALYLMAKGLLSDDVIVVFDGEEETDGTGARQADDFFMEKGIRPLYIVLDITDVHYKKASFTIENMFHFEDDAINVLAVLEEVSSKFKVVCCKQGDRLQNLIPDCFLSKKTATEDDSWTLHKSAKDLTVFSLCVPVKGEYHANEGCKVKKDSYVAYTKAVKAVVNRLAF